MSAQPCANNLAEVPELQGNSPQRQKHNGILQRAVKMFPYFKWLPEVQRLKFQNLITWDLSLKTSG